MAELIDKDEALKLFDNCAFQTMNYVTVKGRLNTLSTVTEAEIRAKAEHTYENCHNITCRRKCQKDGYNMAIDEFAEKLKREYVYIDVTSDDMVYGKYRKYIDEIAEQLKEE